MNTHVMMVTQLMVMAAMINVKFRTDGAVLVEVQHQRAFVLNLFQTEALSFQRALFKEVVKLCKE